MTAHTLAEDFAHFLTVHQLSQQETFTLTDIRKAYAANWKPSRISDRHFSPAFLLTNSRRLLGRLPNAPNWVIAAELFALGHTSAIKICKEAGVEPGGSAANK